MVQEPKDSLDMIWWKTATRCLAEQEPWYGEDATYGDGWSVW